MSLTLEGFRDLYELHRGATALVLRGTRESDGRRVVLKTSAHRHPSDAAMAALIREFGLARRARTPWTVEMLERVERAGVPVLVMEDVDGVGLDVLLRVAPPSFERRLEIALQLARALEAVHAAGVIHKDVNPSNALWCAASGALRVIDFGIATELEYERPTRDDPHRLEGTLAYISPEQTGRTSRTVDRRTDHYSLGVTLYELFTGRRPFASQDVLELVHAHLARRPLPPTAHDETLPEALSAIILRLLAKSPEDRYQSAAGVVADLAECQARLRERGVIAPFPLGVSDRPARLEPPQKLYGREREVGVLLGALERAAGGRREVVLVGGYSGIGKSALVHALLEDVTARRGSFLEGRFEPLQRAVPYAPLGQAFGRLLQSALSQDEAAIARFRGRIAGPLGAHASALRELLPDLAALLGPIAPAPEVPVAEAENRFQYALRALLAAVADAEHPVVLFLDDLQWADVPTLRVLEGLATDEGVRHVLLVGAYRSNEVDAAHPLAITRARLARAGTALAALEVAPPPEAALHRLLVDAFGRDDAELHALAVRCVRRTGGNPFFLRRLLADMVERAAVRWDAAQRRWSFEPDALERLAPSANLVDYLVARLAALPDATRAALGHAACVGRAFDLREVAATLDATPAAVQSDLGPAVRAGLVAPRGKAWQLDELEALERAPDEAYAYAFEHDRILAAAHASLDAPRAQRAHLRLGERLNAAGEAREFEAVEHLNAARALLDPPARIALAARNLGAGRRARRRSAFGAAAGFFEAGLACLPEDAWARHYELTRDLTVASAECAYLVVDFALARRRLDAVQAHALALLDRVDAWRVDIAAHIAQHDLRGAIAIARGALAALGVALPEQPGEADVAAAVGRAMTALGAEGPGRLETLPDVADPVVAAAMTLLVEVSSPAYYAMPALLPIIACELVVSSLEKGPSLATPFGLAVYGIVLNAIGMLPQAHEVGRLALRLLDRWPDRHLEARTRLVVHNNVCSWVAPVQRALDDLLDTYRVGRASGDFEFAAIAAQCWATNAMVAGLPLAEVARTAAELGAFMRSFQQTTALVLHRPLEQLVGALRGRTPTPASLSFDGFDEEEALAAAERAGSPSVSFVTLTDMLVARYQFGTAAEAWAVTARAAPFQAGAASTHHLTTFHTYGALAAARLYPTADAALKPALLAHLDASLKQLEAWAAAGPENFAHRALLLRAERARVAGDASAAEALYRRALEAVRATEYINDEGLVAELAGRFHLARGGADTSIGRAFLEDARFAYQRWGAEAKTRALEAELPDMLARVRVVPNVLEATLSSVEGLDLDAAAMVRAAQGLSAAVELDALLLTLFRTAVAAAGAERARLLLERHGRWEVAVEGDAAGEPALASRALERVDPAAEPVGIVRYVLRTRRALLLTDASERGGLFADDPYVRARRVRSVHCLPVIHRGTPTAVLYLEHGALAGAFNARGAGLMELLVAQAAVSLENARLYEAQRRLLRQQARFVPREFLESLGQDDIAEVAPGQHVEKTMSVLFADLHRFTHLVESLGARSIAGVLNEYFTAMERPIVEARGFIDSFTGDEIMALFDASADHALRAAVAMQRALERFNAEGAGTDRPVLRMGIGVNTGPLLLGVVGGQERIKCGVVGDAVNHASRFERLTRSYGAAVLAGEQTYAALGRPEAFSVRRVDRVVVRGAAKPVTLYEVLDAEPDAVRAVKERTRATWEGALDAYFARDWAQAEALCAECRERAPADRLPAILAERCARFARVPPPSEWDGAERLQEK